MQSEFLDLEEGKRITRGLHGMQQGEGKAYSSLEDLYQLLFEHLLSLKGGM